MKSKTEPANLNILAEPSKTVQKTFEDITNDYSNKILNFPKITGQQENIFNNASFNSIKVSYR